MQGWGEEKEGVSDDEKDDTTTIQRLDEPLVPTNELEISLHSIAGTLHSNTMRLCGWIGGESIVILIDSGSIYNFIDFTLLPKLKLETTVQTQLIVRVANGDVLRSMGLYQGVILRIHGNFCNILLCP